MTCPAAAVAPEPNAYLDVDRLLVGDIMTSRTAMDVLEVLCDDCGSRFAGTPGERRAVEYVADYWRAVGLENARLEEYAYTGWTRGPAALEILAPAARSLDCISLPYCPAGQVEAELLDLGCGTPEAFARSQALIPGRIVMVSSASPPGYGRWIHRKEKYERAVLAGAAAFLFVGEIAGAGPETGSLESDAVAPIPGFSVALEDGTLLARLARRHGPLRLRLVASDRHAPRTSWNAVAELAASPGSDQASQLVLVGCHYDGHDISQGAVDPASGVAIMLEMARVLAAHARPRLRRTVRFVAFGTEEIGLTGSRRYVAAHGDEADRWRFMLNLDGAGGAGRKGFVLHACPELEPYFCRVAAQLAGEVPVGQKVHSASDHFPFLLAGVPTGSLGDPERPPAGRGYGHTAWDTVDKVRLADLQEGAAVCARLVLRLAADAQLPWQRRTPAQVQHIVDTAAGLEGYRLSLELARRRRERDGQTRG